MKVEKMNKLPWGVLIVMISVLGFAFYILGVSLYELDERYNKKKNDLLVSSQMEMDSMMIHQLAKMRFEMWKTLKELDPLLRNDPHVLEALGELWDNQLKSAKSLYISSSLAPNQQLLNSLEVVSPVSGVSETGDRGMNND